MAAAAKKVETPTIRDLARETLAECGNDAQQAIQKLTKRIMGDARLLKELAAEAVFRAVDEGVRGKIHNNRGTLVNAAHAGRSAVIALAGGIKASLLDFQLPDGKAIGDATPAEISPSIIRYEQYGRDAAHKAKWLTLMIQGVPRDKVVRDIITPERAQELWDEAAK